MDNSKDDENENHSNNLQYINYKNNKNNFYKSSIQKIKKKKNSNFSPTNNDISPIKRYKTHYKKNKNKNQEKSDYSVSPSKLKGYTSYKDLEQNIMNKILDISMRIEKEENIISSTQNYENNLNLSTFVKSHKDRESRNNYKSKNKKNSKLKLKKKSNINLKLDSPKSSANNSRLSNNDNSKDDFISKTPVLKEQDKFRALFQKNIIYDSFDSEEDKKMKMKLFISPPKAILL
jgi:hypothetical protein